MHKAKGLIIGVLCWWMKRSVVETRWCNASRASISNKRFNFRIRYCLVTLRHGIVHPLPKGMPSTDLGLASWMQKKHNYVHVYKELYVAALKAVSAVCLPTPRILDSFLDCIGSFYMKDSARNVIWLRTSSTFTVKSISNPSQVTNVSFYRMTRSQTVTSAPPESTMWVLCHFN